LHNPGPSSYVPLKIL